MSTTTPNTDFLPGDRVKARSTTALARDLYGLFATVVEPTIQGYDDYTFFVFDNDPLTPTPSGARHWRTRDIPDMFTRQPIEPGCRVRWIEHVPGRKSIEHRIVKKVWSGINVITFTDNSEVYAKDVVRIADPTTPVLRINLKTGIFTFNAIKAAVTTDFLPGDRVISLVTLKRGTIVKPHHNDINPDISAILWDGDSKPSPHAREYFERQPIEPGCWVRSIHPGCTHIRHHVTGVADKMLEVGDDLLFGENFVRVADPAPAAKPVDIAHLHIVGVHDPRHLMQAQRLAVMLHGRHYADNEPEWKVADDLPGVLDQIDNMTAGLTKTEKLKHLEKRMRDLTDFIRSEIPSEKPRPEEIVDVAIRVMRRQEQALIAVTKILNPFRDRPGSIGAWLSKYDPQPFKRGDLVTWGAGQIHGRIVGPAPTVQAPWEVIITAVPGSAGSSSLGTFVTPDLASLRHSETHRHEW